MWEVLEGGGGLLDGVPVLLNFQRLAQVKLADRAGAIDNDMLYTTNPVCGSFAGREPSDSELLKTDDLFLSLGSLWLRRS